FLCVSGWISVSVSEFHTVEVQSGEDVTLQCTNYSSTTGHIHWFRLDNRPNISCISSMSDSDGNASFCDGFKNGRFNMTSNVTTVFLQIKSVDSSDSGLYFCGSHCGDNQNVKAVIVSATYLKVQEESVEPSTVTSVILGGLIIFLIIVVIVVVVKTRKLRADLKTEEQSPLHREVI
ncbi:T-cell surface glycoprotein CD8 beta chain-like, partial [Trachinotus anak]|uniref:T-cell surface glycoprotein CD8 beta chain-like n=1 Tax=Trachinotus anak TaxID=443729 RepID=UPI0039F16DC6